MLFCNCRGIPVSQIMTEIASGNCDYQAAHRACADGGPVCGMCEDDFNSLLKQHDRAKPTLAAA